MIIFPSMMSQNYSLNHVSLCDDADQPSLGAIGQSHRLGGQTTARGNLLHHALNHGEALGSAEAPERRVGGQEGLTHQASPTQVWDAVAVVHVEESFLHDLGTCRETGAELH